MSLEDNVCKFMPRQYREEHRENEQRLLGALLTNHELVSEAINHIDSDKFVIKQHVIIFEAIVSVFKGGMYEVDIVTVSEMLKTQGKLKQVGGRLYINALSLAAGD